MGSEFKKLIIDVFGQNAYNRYTVFVKNNFRRKSAESRNVYNDIYRMLHTASQSILIDMKEHVEEVMVRVVRICRTYIVAVLVYALAMTLMLMFGNTPMIKYLGAGLLSLAFLYKTGEFLVNKYCFVDARIILTYKSVLERLIEEKESEPKIELIEDEHEFEDKSKR